MKKLIGILVVCLSLSLLIPGYVSDDLPDECSPEILLPEDQVSMVSMELPTDLDAYFKIELSGIIGDYDVEDGLYLGWCLDFGTPISSGPTHIVTLISSYTPPAYLSDEDWHMVNYILNHKQGDRSDIQRAIWYFVNFGPWAWDYTGWAPFSEPVAQATTDMINDALANSADWCPECDDVIAVIGDPGSLESFQIIIIEFEMPCYQGCTPGFWKKSPKDGAVYNPPDGMPDWPSPYFYDNDLTEVFGLDAFWDEPERFNGDTLGDALSYGGGAGFFGMAKKLMSHAVAGLLNAAHPDVNYYMDDPADIIHSVQNVLNGHGSDDLTDPLVVMMWRNSMEDLKNDFVDWNEAGCSINVWGEPCDGGCED